ncbi:hypothetical protein [Rhizobium sp. SSA_523]|uniref:hypothetical protein n=1 Tax=Rhizobium sp. SSA_523 TaxID=2952477 RepID=UPI002091D02E|nr:hypothetical protein [Rhizobium sp. SSA_523]MCO5731992.1 hypothetical protein [Rhizobium sp. SSA_523]WKC22666.1 hypothetical protein QTJ18_17565 [Rhizobium sp. SSA_523]
MMMFTRLKTRSVETGLFLLAVNLATIILMAIMAGGSSRGILGFSIVAALAAIGACIVFIRGVRTPLNHMARQTLAAGTGKVHLDACHLQRSDDLGVLARALVRREEPRIAEPDLSTIHVHAIGEAVRRLSNGDLNCQIGDSLPEPLESLRMRVNRLSAMLNINLYAVRENNAEMKERARASQGDLAIIAERIRNCLPTAAKAMSATDVLHRSAHRRHDDARFIVRQAQEARMHGADMPDLAATAGAALEASSHSLDELTRLAHAVGDLAIEAEALHSALTAAPTPSEAPIPSTGVPMARALADKAVKTTEQILRQCRETDLLLAEGQRATQRLERMAGHTDKALADLIEPAERLARNVDLETQRLSLAHLAATETDHVLTRALDIVQSTEGSMIRIISEAGSLETRLSTFHLSAPDRDGNRLNGDKPSLRCIT